MIAVMCCGGVVGANGGYKWLKKFGRMEEACYFCVPLAEKG